MDVKSWDDVDLQGKRVLIREDLNVPVDEAGNVTSDARLLAALPTIEQALDRGAAVMLLSHRGRPQEGVYNAIYSLQPVAHRLSALLNRPVRLAQDWVQGVDVQPGEVVLCENVRFNAGESQCDDQLSQQLAALGDVFVMDAFATAHRAHASTVGIAKYSAQACAGPLLKKELSALSAAFEAPQAPLVAIVGGAKVSTKLDVLFSLIEKVNVLIVGGGMANTFLAAQGVPMGDSLYEKDYLEKANEILRIAKSRGVEVPLPVDVRVADEFSIDAKAQVLAVSELQGVGMIMDIGPQTEQLYAAYLQSAATIIWNGPVGVFEFPAFSEGTRAIAAAVAQSDAFSIAGGGDTLAALDLFSEPGQVSYVSTGGGAFLEFLEGKSLPGVSVLLNN